MYRRRIAKATKYTIIGIYIRPNTETEDIMELLTFSFQKITNPKESIILAGDMNCRIDKSDMKCKAILAFLKEENFKITNDPKCKTYFAHNGSSTIHLVFHKGDNIETLEQKGLWTSQITPLRKHIPIQTKFSIKTPQKTISKHVRNTMSRDINIAALERELGKATEAEQVIKENDLNTALTTINKMLETSITHKQNTRKAQPWFDKECYAERQTALSALHIAKMTLEPEDLRVYGEKWRYYKNLLKQKHTQYIE